MCEFNTKITIAHLLRFTLQDEVIYHYVIPSFWKWQLLYYWSASQFFADFGAHPPVSLFNPGKQITQHDIKIHKGWKYHKNIFQPKKLLKQSTYLLLEAKNPSYFNCVHANKRHNPCHKAYAIK